MTRPHDMAGRRFGLLTVSSRVANDRSGKSQWLCACDCGQSTTARATDLVRGKVVSCSCHRNRLGADRNRTHDLTGTPLYYVWGAIKSRCFNPACPAYKNYGGRGITMCDRWRESFEAFLADMATRLEQAANKRPQRRAA